MPHKSLKICKSMKMNSNWYHTTIWNCSNNTDNNFPLPDVDRIKFPSTWSRLQAVLTAYYWTCCPTGDHLRSIPAAVYFTRSIANHSWSILPPSHLTELVSQSEISPPPCQQQPTSAELKVSPESSDPSAQEQVSAYISHTGMQNVKQPFNNAII